MPVALSRFVAADGSDYRFDSEIGVGGQATVWRVTRLSDSRAMALKLFKSPPSGAERTRQEERLQRVCAVAQEIAESLPEAQVCFPRTVHTVHGEFGVLMDLATGKPMNDQSMFVNPLDQPQQYVSGALLSVLKDVSQYFHFLLAGFHLSRAIAVVHRHGMAHCDLSLANVLVETTDGRVSLIDCDNLACGGYLPVKVAGTPGFQAPELIGHAAAGPSPETDRHSLAVLLFYLAMFRHPLVGNTGTNWNPEHKSEDEAFGKNAVFTDHPKNKKNAFKDGLPFGALPLTLQTLFTKAFTDGLKAPAVRPTARVWARELWQALESMTVCTRCRQRFFLNDPDATCLFCEARNFRQRWRLSFNDGRQTLAEPGRKLYEHHLLDMEFQFKRPLAEMRLRDGDMQMKNIGPAPWTVRLHNGGVLSCESGKAFRFDGVASVEFEQGRTARIHKV